MRNYDKVRQVLIERNKSAKQRLAVRNAFFQDLTGQKFNRLTVLKFFGNPGDGNSKWECLCDCGKTNIVGSYKLKSGKTKSCGCYNRDRATTHKMTNTRFYNIFKALKHRCEGINYPKFHLYGGKGIKCLWNSFEEFRDDMFESYESHVKEFGERDTSIDRINGNDHYYKENCRWATLLEQARNTKNVIRIPFNGKILTLGEVAEKLGIRKKTLANRLYAGWSIEKTLTY